MHALVAAVTSGDYDGLQQLSVAAQLQLHNKSGIPSVNPYTSLGSFFDQDRGLCPRDSPLAHLGQDRELCPRDSPYCILSQDSICSPLGSLRPFGPFQEQVISSGTVSSARKRLFGEIELDLSDLKVNKPRRKVLKRDPHTIEQLHSHTHKHMPSRYKQEHHCIGPTQKPNGVPEYIFDSNEEPSSDYRAYALHALSLMPRKFQLKLVFQDFFIRAQCLMYFYKQSRLRFLVYLYAADRVVELSNWLLDLTHILYNCYSDRWIKYFTNKANGVRKGHGNTKNQARNSYQLTNILKIDDLSDPRFHYLLPDLKLPNGRKFTETTNAINAIDTFKASNPIFKCYGGQDAKYQRIFKNPLPPMTQRQKDNFIHKCHKRVSVGVTCKDKDNCALCKQKILPIIKGESNAALLRRIIERRMGPHYQLMKPIEQGYLKAPVHSIRTARLHGLL